MLVPALILGVTGYAIYRYYSSDDDDQRQPPPAARPYDFYSSGYYSDYYDYDSDTAEAYGSTRINASVTTGAYGYPGTAGYSGASTSASYRTTSYSGTYSARNPQPARSPVHHPTTGTSTTTTYQRNNQRVGSSNQTQRSNNNRTTGNRNNNNNNNNNRNQQNSTESTEQLQLRRSVLRRFKCPFEEEEACRFKQNPQQCLFTHVGSDGTGATNLKEVPAYACIYHLINSCRSVNNSTNNAHNPNSIQNILPCINGIHLSMDQMADLDRYERANRQTIRRFFGRDADRECGVCLETVLSKRLSRTRRFAILENCEHCFCVQCIVGWRSRNVELTCPLCRTVSRRVVYRRRFTDKPEYKRNLFR